MYAETITVAGFILAWLIPGSENAIILGGRTFNNAPQAVLFAQEFDAEITAHNAESLAEPWANPFEAPIFGDRDSEVCWNAKDRKGWCLIRKTKTHWYLYCEEDDTIYAVQSKHADRFSEKENEWSHYQDVPRSLKYLFLPVYGKSTDVDGHELFVMPGYSFPTDNKPDYKQQAYDEMLDKWAEGKKKWAKKAKGKLPSSLVDLKPTPYNVGYASPEKNKKRSMFVEY